MRIPVLISIALHISVIVFLIFWSTTSRLFPRKMDVYQVELVSMPPPVKKVTMKKESPKPEIKPPAPQPKPVKEKSAAVKTTTKKVKKETPKATPVKEESAAPARQSGKQVKVDTKDFPFSYYLNLLRYRVQENWKPPYQSSGQAEKISAIVGFRVLRNGKIAEVAVETSSNKYLFDQAAQRAVYAAGPLPPLPEEFSGEQLTVHIEFEATW